MKPVTIPFLLLLLFGHRACAQSDEQFGHKLAVSISPLSLIDYSDGSSIRVSVDARVHNQFSFSAEAGTYTSMANYFSYRQNPRGFIIKPCLKFYWRRKKQIADPGSEVNSRYLAIEYQYKQQSYQLTDSISLPVTGTYRKDYAATKSVNCISLKYGLLFTSPDSRFFYELYGGIGIRFSNASSTLTDDEYKGLLRGEGHHNSTVAGYSSREMGNYVYPDLLLGVKVGLRVF